MTTICSTNSNSPVLQVAYAAIHNAWPCGFIPIDDTIPQGNEGTEVLQLTITPKYATSRIVIDFSTFTKQIVGGTVIAALFQDSGANAICSTLMDTVTSSTCLRLTHVLTSGTTSPTTFKIRCGSGGGGSVTLNADNAGNQLYGGVASTILIVREFAV